MLSITRMSVLPPGGYSYKQPETGMKFDGNTAFKPQVMQIRAHRLGNHLPRTTVEEVTQDLLDAVCARVPGVCNDSSVITAYSVATGRVTRTANSPGQPREVRKCGSCGGRRK
jgi:hypothetical protein